MTNKFTTSINIIRDSEREINYIPTPNAIRVVNQIVNDFKTGIRSFSIIGSYGTGKSAFLWAFRQSILNRKKYFNINLLANPRIDFINIIGEYKSIKQFFAEFFELENTSHISENIFSELFNRYHDLGNKNPILFLVIDEFGKFLEYASQNEPEGELYFLQQLAEFVNNPDNNIVLFTTVHQNFDAYALSLTQVQKQEWVKVKGRFRETTFNEPVEQLLFLASEKLNKKPSTNKYAIQIKQAINLLFTSKAFTVNEDYINEIAENLFPLDALSAYTLTLSLQKYGQNERSLFSFLESTDHTGLFQHKELGKGLYTIADVYDYLIFNYYTLLNSKYNPDFGVWKSIKTALERVETSFDSNIKEYSKIIKVIGLLNINAQAGASLDRAFLLSYIEKCLGINDALQLIGNLETQKIILYRAYNKRFILFEGTDLDIQTALIEAGSKVDNITDVVTLLKRHYPLPSIIAKKAMYETGTPRLFEYKISSYPINDIPLDEIDGFINLVFNERDILNEIINHSKNNEEAVLYCFYKNSKSIKELLFEIEKTERVVNENSGDKFALKELNNILIHQRNLLSHKILNNFSNNSSEVVWYFKGEKIIITSKKELNATLSIICNKVYSKTPSFNNELVNKHKISASINTAKKNYFRALVDNWNKPNLGFESNKFPPEKTIYLTLLKENGIELYNDKANNAIEIPETSSFKYLWEYSVSFLNFTKQGKKTVAAFIEPLTRSPFKIKQGVIDFWVASFLFIKRNDFALFGESGYIPYLTDEILELVIKYPENYEIKALDIEGVKLDIFNSYRLFLNQGSKEQMSNQTFIETIKPFLTFYKGLSEYAKNTKRLPKEAIALREAIVQSKDPEKSFFEDFPNALGYSMDVLQQSKEDLQAYIIKLQEAIRVLRGSYDELLQRFEIFITQEIIGEQLAFEGYKPKLQQRFNKIKKHLCLPYQKTFIQRLDSQLDDKKAWLNSIAQSVVGKSLDNLKDEDEFALYDKFKTIVVELDTLTNLSRTSIDDAIEEAFGIEMSSYSEGIQKRIVRLPKAKVVEINNIEDAIKLHLSKDKSLNIVAIANILKELLQP